MLAERRQSISHAATVEDADHSSVDYNSQGNDEERNEITRNDGNEAAPGNLCSRCRGLGLTMGHFIIDRVAEAAPRWRHGGRYSTNFGKRKEEANAGFFLRTGRARQEFATLDDLHSRRESCSFCNLASTAIKRYGHRSIKSETMCYFTWEVDGRAKPEELGYSDPLFRKVVNKTRRLKLDWGQGTYYGQVYLVLAVRESTSDSGMGPLPMPWQETHSLGREFSDQAEKQAVMRGWLNSCANEHKDTCSSRSGTRHDFLKLIGETYFGVIDVLDMQLKSLPMIDDDGIRYPDRYVALSYVWGEGSKRSCYVTTDATVKAHIRPGGLAAPWAKLPRTIQDAVLLVNRLGLRYLWVDALCISQNNERAWENNAKAMHLIYGHAYFTICAADGDAESGLKAAAPTLQATQQGWSPFTNGTPQDQSYYDDTIPISTQYAHGLRILVTRPLDVVIQDSKWSKRAWTFQEQILSCRCLIFAEGRVYFQCRLAGISEDIWTDSKGNGWSLNRTNSPLQSPSLLKGRPIWFYMKFTQQYTSRCLTKARDILSAFDGITRLLEEHMSYEPFFFGLPSSHFDLALLWSPTRAFRRRKKTKSHHSGNLPCSQDANGRCTCHLENVYLDGVKSQFPSWSWCGWMGDQETGSQVVYDESMLEGCMSNISKWLEDRTWITWYLRDSKGHLRPLRDNAIRTNRRDVHEEDRWNGYAGSQAWQPLIDDSSSQIVEMRIPKADENSQPMASSSNRRDLGSTRSTSSSVFPKKQARFSYRDDKPDKKVLQRYEKSEERSGSRFMKYRVGNGGYFRRGSLLETGRQYGHDQNRSSTRYLQDIALKSDDIGSIIPENPFGTIREPEPFVRRRARPEAETSPQASLPPYSPLLQFCTLYVKLYVSTRKSTPSLSNGLCVCDVADDYGDWCGSVTVPQTWIDQHQNKRLDFIAISEARAFTMDECPVWTYYVPKERGESQWDIFYVLLLERDEEHCSWERVALGKVFKAAFETAEWDEIQLG